MLEMLDIEMFTPNQDFDNKRNNVSRFVNNPEFLDEFHPYGPQIGDY